MKFCSCIFWMIWSMSSSTWSSVSCFEFFLGLFVEELAGFEGLTDGFAEVLHGLVAVELLEAGVGVVEAGVEEEVGEGLHEVFEAEGGGEVAGEFCVADALHVWAAPLYLMILVIVTMDILQNGAGACGFAILPRSGRRRLTMAVAQEDQALYAIVSGKAPRRSTT